MHAKLSSSIALVVLASTAIAQYAIPVGNMIPSYRVRRQVVDVGASNCPAGQFQCQAIVGCCPTGYYCGSFDGKNGCCPEGQNCNTIVPPPANTVTGNNAAPTSGGTDDNGGNNSGSDDGNNGNDSDNNGGNGGGSDDGNTGSPTATGAGTDGNGIAPTLTDAAAATSVIDSISSAGSAAATSIDAAASSIASSLESVGSEATASLSSLGSSITGSISSVISSVTSAAADATKTGDGSGTDENGAGLVPISTVSSNGTAVSTVFSTPTEDIPAATSSGAGNSGSHIQPTAFSALALFTALIGSAIMIGGTAFCVMI